MAYKTIYRSLCASAANPRSHTYYYITAIEIATPAENPAANKFKGFAFPRFLSAMYKTKFSADNPMFNAINIIFVFAPDTQQSI